MIVSEVIKALKAFPKDAEVYIQRIPHNFFGMVEDVYMDDEGTVVLAHINQAKEEESIIRRYEDSSD